MLTCVDGNLVGLNVTDQLPSPAGVVVPSSVPVSRSPRIHTSMRSIAPGPFAGSVAMPVIVKSALPAALTFWPSVGAITLRVGAPPAVVAPDGAGAGAAAAAAPPPLTETVLNHQPLPPVCRYT